MKFRSLQVSLQNILISMVILLLVTGVGVLLLGNYSFSKIYQNLYAQEMVSTYFMEMTACQELLESVLVDTTGQSTAGCYEQLEILTEVSQKVTDKIQHPQFTDLYYMTESYVETAKEFLAEADTYRDFTLYENARYAGSLIQGRYVSMTMTKEKIGLEYIRVFSHNWRVIVISILAVIFFLSAIVFTIGMRFIRKTITPIVHLTQQSEQLAAGKLNVNALSSLPADNNETRVLTVAFQKMASTISRQMEQLEEKIAVDQELHRLELENIKMQMTLAKTENLFAQSLINPHFLFNCLNTLAGLAHIERASRTKDAANKIAFFLRESIGRIGRNITLKEELEHVQQYIEIQQLRFGERISFEIECEEKCEQAVMPAMLVQPLVENAISHGVGSYLKNGRIHIKASLEESETLAIIVKDNGVGIKEDKITEIYKDSQEEYSARNHGIGLRSILTRMKASMGNTGELRIESSPGNTNVVLRFPYQVQTYI